VDYTPEILHPRMWSPISVLTGLGHGRPYEFFQGGAGATDMASAERQPITGSSPGAEPPAGSRGRAPSQGVTGRSGAPQRGSGAEPLLRGQGRSPLKLKALKHLHTYEEGLKIC